MGWILRTLLTISLVTLPLYLYIGLRLAGSAGFIRPEKKRVARRVALLVIGWIYLLPGIVLGLHAFKSTRILFIFSDSLTLGDYLLHYPVWLGMIVVLELTPLFLVLELVTLGGRLSRTPRDRLRSILAYGRIILAGTVFLYVTVRVVLDTAHIRDTTVQLQLAALPGELDNFRITLVGDVQVDRYTGEGKVRQLHEIVAERDPELLLSSGDIVTAGTNFLEAAARAVCDLKGSLGTVAVLGDHDYWSAPISVRKLHEDCGWTFLENEHRVYHHRGRTILVSGLTYIYSRRLSEPELAQFLKQAPEADVRILLTHQPAEQLVRRAADAGYDLILAGHTHGGQIVLHPLGIPFTPSMLETQYYEGVRQIGSTYVVVTRGVGLTLAPVRYHAPAEVTTIVLGKAIVRQP